MSIRAGLVGSSQRSLLRGSNAVRGSRCDWPSVMLFALMLAAPTAASADVYKYVDARGNVYFSDEPLKGESFELEWKRTAKRLSSENRRQSEAHERERQAAAQAQARLKQSGDDVYAARPSTRISGSMSVRRARYQHLIESAARRHGLNPELLHAVIRAESAYKPDALSHAGACGLMQLMPATARRFRVHDIWDPAANIEGGARYLRLLLDMFDHDLRLALAAYNAGENAVKRYGNQIPPYRETQGYVRKVLQHLWAERASRSS
jgi:soluble lytic murein transglycosylase-like protein